MKVRIHPPPLPLPQVALPELDGAIEPIVFAGRDSNTGKSHSLPDRISSLCSRAIKWAALRRKKNAEKRLAVTVFSFPPDKVRAAAAGRWGGGCGGMRAVRGGEQRGPGWVA